MFLVMKCNLRDTFSCVCVCVYENERMSCFLKYVEIMLLKYISVLEDFQYINSEEATI